MLGTVIPFMGFVAMLIGIINASGFGNWFSLLTPLAGTGWGLMALLHRLPAIPVAAAGAGRRHRQIIGTLIGVEIGKQHPAEPRSRRCSPSIPKCRRLHPCRTGSGGGPTGDRRVGVPSVLYSRFLNGVPRVAVAWLASIGLYSS